MPALNESPLDLEPGAGLGSEPSEEPSLRDDLDAAFEAQPSDEPGVSQAGDTRPRDEYGRFAKGSERGQERVEPFRQGQGTGQAQRPAAAGPAGAAQAQPAELKAPQSWTPAAREKWQAVPAEVQAEIHRRESEMGRMLQTTAQDRQAIDAFERIVRPYELFIAQENSTPLQAVASLFKTAAELRVGTPQTKAALVAGIISDYGIDINTLDNYLEARVKGGTVSVQQPQAQQPMRDPRVDQYLWQMQQQQAYAEQVETHQMRQGLDAFAQAHEFYSDVAATMADIVEVRARQGQAIDLEQIYHQACALDPQVSTIVNQRSTRSAQPSQALLRAKRAAVSVRNESTPQGATIPRDDSVRAGIEAAIESLGRT